jgi:VanZ family protein
MPDSSRLFLPRYVLTAYLLLIVYASLYPFSGWRDQGVAPDAFLFAPMPRYFTIFDVATNLVGYFPLGFLAVLALHMPHRPWRAIALATLSAALLSIVLEAVQTYLPSRVASNLDVICNMAGAFLGALVGARLAPVLLSERMRGLRAEWLAPGRHADLGMVLLGLWLLTQANPALLLFGNGDLRAGLGLGLAPFSAEGFRTMETAIVALNLIALGALTALIVRECIYAWAVVSLMVFATLLTKALASALLFKPENYGVWLTPGAQDGLTIGMLVLMFLPWLPRGLLAVLAVLLLGSAVLMVNLVPENPYHTANLPQWQQGQFLNFNGATGTVALLWPFGAMIWAASVRRLRKTPDDTPQTQDMDKAS